MDKNKHVVIFPRFLAGVVGLPEYKLKVVNICAMHRTGILQLWCYEIFDQIR